MSCRAFATLRLSLINSSVVYLFNWLKRAMDVDKFDIPLMRPRLPNAEAVVPYLSEIDINQWYSNYGPLEQRLRSRFANMFSVGPENVVLTANGTLGLTMALREAAKGLRGLCVMPSYFCCKRSCSGCRSHVFVDVDSVIGDWIPIMYANIWFGWKRAAVLPVSPFGAP